MREIKFRAWNKENKEMVEVELLGKEVLLYKNGEWENIENFEVMQFTGLYDKNGREIYEGDIVECFNNGNSYVSFKGGVYGLISNYGFIPFSDVHGKMKVIGNIFQDGDLLRDS